MRHIATYPETIAPRWGKEEREYQEVRPRRPYVFGTGGNNALIHRIRVVRLRWWTTGPKGEYLIRLQSPRMTAVTYCNRWISIDGTKAKSCQVPRPDAVLCGMCHGQGVNFPRGRKHDVPIAEARVRLGCIEVPE